MSNPKARKPREEKTSMVEEVHKKALQKKIGPSFNSITTKHRSLAFIDLKIQPIWSLDVDVQY
jgi:hypothetical protein